MTNLFIINYMETLGNPCLRSFPDTNWQGNCHITAVGAVGTVTAIACRGSEFDRVGN
jgi:hypothetical protein